MVIKIRSFFLGGLLEILLYNNQEELLFVLQNISTTEQHLVDT